jgi:hypothetical protein
MMHLNQQNLRCSCKVVMKQEKVEDRIFKLVPALSLAVMQRTDADADSKMRDLKMPMICKTRRANLHSSRNYFRTEFKMGN